MEQIIEFTINHPFLIGSLVILVGLFIAVEVREMAAGISPLQLVNMINKESAVVIDIRDKKEYKKGCILHSKHIPFSSIEQSMQTISKYKNTPVIIVDAIGHNSNTIAQKLEKAGFSDVFRLKGGIASWLEANLPLNKP